MKAVMEKGGWEKQERRLQEGKLAEASSYRNAKVETLPQQRGVKSDHLKKGCPSRTLKGWEG